MEKPLVSFILGVYNTQNFNDLDRSFKTMLEQSYGNTEIIVCDDCSTNGVYEYIKSQYGDNKRVTIIQNRENLGLNVSLNNCLKYVNGSYIARQDDDDYSDIDRIQRQMNILLSDSDIAFVSAGLVKFDDEGEWDPFIPKENPVKNDFLNHSPFAHAVSIFRKEAIIAVGGYRISPETVRCEDYDLFMRLTAAGFKGKNIPEVLYYYNKDRGQKIKRTFKNCYNEFVVRRKGYRIMRLPIWSLLFSLKPIIVYLIPSFVSLYIKKIISNRYVIKN